MKEYVVSLLAGLLLVASMSVAQTNSPDLFVLVMKKQGQEQALLDGYGKALGSMMAELTKKGNLDAYVVVEAEKKRLEAEKVVLAVTNELFKAPADVYFRSRVTLSKQYIAALDNFIKAEMKAGKLDEAKSAKADRDRTILELADLESKLPRTVDTNAVVKAEQKKKAYSVVGAWNMHNGSTGGDGVIVFHPSGRLEDKGAVKFCGKYEFTNAEKTELKRTCNNGWVIMYTYDPVMDTLVQHGENIEKMNLTFTKVPAKTKGK